MFSFKWVIFSTMVAPGMYVIPPVIVRVGCPPVWVSIDENTRLIFMVVTFFLVSGFRVKVQGAKIQRFKHEKHRDWVPHRAPNPFSPEVN
jgi:hypothetical protein